MNVLVSSAGRRTSLIRGFQAAVSPLGGVVVATDADPIAPGLHVADEGVVVPRLDRPGFVDRLVAECERHEVRLVVPTIDTELPVLSDESARFEAVGAVVLVSDRELIDATVDKRRTESVFGAAGIRMPRSFDVSDSALPDRVFVKPARGSASQGTHVVDRDRLTSFLEMVDEPMVQELVDATEITIDALLDLDGNPVHMVPRIRLKTVGGESVQGVTMPDEPIRDWLIRVLDVVSGLGGIGPITLQAFLTEGSPTLIEVNPRFGGGFPLALAAGADYPRWIVDALRGEKIPPRFGAYRKGLFMTRSLDEVFIDSDWDQ